MINNEHQDLLDRYFRHEMTADEYSRMETLLRNDPDFAREAELMEHTVNAIERLNEQKALAEMQARPRRRTPRKRFIIALLSAAAIILLVLYIGTSPQYSSHQLFENYYVPFQQEKVPSRGDDLSEVEQQTALLEAIGDMEAGRTENATTKLRHLSQQDILYAADARWYLALLHLQQDERTAARQLLERLQQTDNIYREQATELLMKLNKRKWF